jgi:hypothetical protein
MLNIADILTEVGVDVTERIKQNLVDADRIATSGTYQSVEYIADAYSLTIKANKNILALQNGRKPSANGQKGSKVLFDQILKWIDDKGLAYDIKKESLAFLITRKIHREGYEGTPGLIDDVVNDELITKIEEKLGIAVKQNILNGINSNPKTTAGVV